MNLPRITPKNKPHSASFVPVPNGFAYVATYVDGLKRCHPLESRFIAGLVNKHPTSVSRWLNSGLRMERDEPEFRSRIDALARLISAEETDNATMRNVAP